jgi:putative SOS response-associated peptidase YedK
MCGRVKMATDYSELKIKFSIDDSQPAPNSEPNYNAPPTSGMLVLRLDSACRRLIEKMRWGLVPSWAKDPKKLGSTFNARAETVHEKPAFRGAWRAGRRCLVLVDLFYEWNRRGNAKQPYAIAHRDRTTMALAGLYEIWHETTKDGEIIETVKTCTIITTHANEQMDGLHDRMPVILSEEQWPAWLGEVPATEHELKAMLTPYDGELAIWPVDPRIGNVRNNDPGLPEPIILPSNPSLQVDH